MAIKEVNMLDRMKGLSLEKRKLVERLIAEKGLKNQTCTETVKQDAVTKQSQAEESVATKHYRAPESTVERHDWAEPGTKDSTRNMYDAYHEKCNATVFGEHSWFMNLGYVATDNKQYSQVTLPAHMPNRNSTNLVLEVLGDCDLEDCEMLDVGSGRGGMIHQIQTHFKPRSTTGIDLSPEGVAYCKRVHRYPNTNFIKGDAEDLPFNDASFDVVTNVESSHSYPNRYNFYRGVWRVLRSGGYFLYSDVLPVDMFKESMEFLKQLGFEVERDQNITENVMTSCAQMADFQFDAFSKDDNDEWMANAIGVPGSQIYEDMKNGITNFRITKLRKL